MVFPQVPVYLDPPNWHQQLNHHQHGTGSDNPQLPVPPPFPTPTDHHHHHHHVGPGSIRNGSTADRARLANKFPQPEAVQKCPRCESTNTKFCYFNNYSLTQPRHFCKTCRRYWTRGGALRSVPVGGGFRRNKKKSSSTGSSKSTISAERQSGSNSTNNAVNIPSEITAHLPHQTPHLPNSMASLQSFSQYGMGNIGLNFGGIQGQNGQGDMGFQIGTNSDILSVRSGNHHQQFPFFEPNNNGLCNPLQSEYMEASASTVGSETQFLRSTSPSPRVSQRGLVKMESNNQGQGLNLTRSLLVVSDNQNNNQYWGGNNWTDLSGLK